MRPILSDIRSCPGVTGVAVIAKRDGRIESIFPAAFTERHTQRLLDLITATYQRLRGFTHLVLRFERVIVHLYNQPEYLLFLSVLPDIDTAHLERVVQSRFGLIARVLAAPAGSAADPPRSTDAKAQPAHDPVTILLGACNALSDGLADSRGRVRLASEWRQAREQANQAENVLAGLSIDAAGRLGVRRGHTLPCNSTTVAALAMMIDLFLENLGTQRALAEEEFYALLERSRSILEPAGVYLYLSTFAQPSSARAQHVR